MKCTKNNGALNYWLNAEIGYIVLFPFFFLFHSEMILSKSEPLQVRYVARIW